MLPSKVGSPLSLKSLEEDLQVSQPTIQRWVNLLSLMYYCYTIVPFGSPKIRAVKKLHKLYMWDWSQVEEEGFRFENLVASQLLKYCHFLEDVEGYKMELKYLRDTDGREINFVVMKTNKPEFYQVHLKEKDFGDSKSGRVLPFITVCREKICHRLVCSNKPIWPK